jgi:hypothetical protein
MATENVTAAPDEAEGLSAEELEAEVALDLPDREALSLAFPLAVATTPAMASKGAETVVDAAEVPVDEGS